MALQFSTTNAQLNWTKFKSTDHHFEVLMPALPTMQEKQIPSSIGTVKHVSFHVSGEEEGLNVYYAVQIVYYPESSFSKDSVEMIQDFLKETVLSIANSTYTGVVYNQEVEGGSSPSRIFRLANNEKGIGYKGKVFLVGDTFYTVQVMFNKLNSLNKDADFFLDSFKVLR